MGVCSSCEGDKRYTPDQMAHDLPLWYLDDKIEYNAYDLLERKFPLARTHIDYFMYQIGSIGSDKFSIEQLAEKFTT